jgi:hypothetical protein
VGTPGLMVVVAVVTKTLASFFIFKTIFSTVTLALSLF